MSVRPKSPRLGSKGKGSAQGTCRPHAPLQAMLQGWGSALRDGDMDSGFLSFPWVVAQTVVELGTLVKTQWLEVLFLCTLR